ncbi:MAG: hypothetical protein IPG96_03270 [Proteobacteria bacterium]|nr:hypothetical protein [Pseudomonadota bacterium]
MRPNERDRPGGGLRSPRHPRGRRRTALLILALALSTRLAQAERTALLELDLESGTQRRIDQRAGSALDDALDAVLGETGGGFTTADLARLAAALRRELRQAHSGSAARLLLFLYPGRISRSRLADLPEVLVDTDLLLDPCRRTVCREAIAEQLEVFGRALRQTLGRTRSARLHFQSVTVRAVSDAGARSFDAYRFTADQVLAAAARGGGRRLLDELERAEAGYEREMAQAIARRAQLRRVALTQTPQVARTEGRLAVELEFRSDRVRYESDVLAALAAATEALQGSSLTPAQVDLTAVALIRLRTTERRRFRCGAEPLRLWLAGRLSAAELWGTYLRGDEPADAARLTFDGDEGTGSAAEEGPDRSGELLAAHAEPLLACLRDEAARNTRLRGVTLELRLAPSGRAERVEVEEREASARLRQCLRAAVATIPFQGREGAPRVIRYPMYIQR